MGFLKKFGSFMSGGEPAKHHVVQKVFKRHGAANDTSNSSVRIPEVGAPTTDDLGESLRAYQDAMKKAAEETRRRIAADMKASSPPATSGVIPSESYYDEWRRELEQEARDDWDRRKNWTEGSQRRLDPLLRFLGGEMIDVTSTNVAQAQYDRDHHMLYLIFKNGGWYRYLDISPQEAESFYNAGSKGGWVWDNLRVRGTVFGYKKDYEFMRYSIGGSYQPKYVENATWDAEHSAIPAGGDLPDNWVMGKGPYTLPWLLSRNPGLFPKAKVFRRKGKVGDGKEPIGKWLGQT